MQPLKSATNLTFSFGHTSNLTIEVGGKLKERFSVHRDLLGAASSKIKQLIDAPSQSLDMSNVLAFDGTKPDTFRLFLDWLYFRRIPSGRRYVFQLDFCMHCEGKCQMPLDAAADESSVLVAGDELPRFLNRYAEEAGIVDLYVFATHYDIPLLRETIVDQEWCDVYAAGDIFTYQDTIKIFQELPAQSPLRCLVLDTFVSFWCPEYYGRCSVDQTLFHELPKELILKAMSLFAKRRDDACFMQQLNAPCAYHEHDNTEVAREACRAKHASLHKRKQSEMARTEKLFGAIAGERS